MNGHCIHCDGELYVLNQTIGICNHCGENQSEIEGGAESLQQTRRSDEAHTSRRNLFNQSTFR